VSAAKVLLIEDDETTRKVLTKLLTNEGLLVCSAGTGKDALTSAITFRPDVILLDYHLPDTDGFEVCKSLKLSRLTSSVPVIMVTGRNTDTDTVTALEIGADDYVTKPFSSAVLLARLRAAIRRHRAQEISDDYTPLNVHSIGIDEQKVRVTIRDQEVRLTATEFKLISMLASKPGRTFTRGQIVEKLNNGMHPVTERSIDVHMVSLRKKLLGVGDVIETIRGIGYRMKDVQ
jgi:DNA-binding response OmpR family regulator